MNILQKFTLLSICTSIAIVIGLSLLVSNVVTTGMLRDEGNLTAEALRIVTSIDLTPSGFDAAAAAGDGGTFSYIWQHLQQIPGVFRIKFYDATGRIVWSDEAALIGKTYADNDDLDEALKGYIKVEMGEVKAEHEYETELFPEGEMLEIYVPLLTPDGGVYGIAEIYKHPERFFAHRRFVLKTVWTAGIGGGALLFVVLFGLFRGALAEQIRLQRVAAEYAAFELELAVAGRIQHRLVPKSLPEAAGCSISALHEMSRQVGGDYYDAFSAEDGGIWLAVADAEGKGIPGALMVVEVRHHLRAQAGIAAEARDAVAAVNAALVGDVSPDRMVTLFLARLDAASRTLTYCNAGHCPGLLVRDGEVSELDVGGVPVGVTDSAVYEQGTAALQAGDVVVLYTDGITEATGPSGEQFGPGRLKETVAAAADSRDPRAVVQAVRDSVRRFTVDAPPEDDTTIVCVVVA